MIMIAFCTVSIVASSIYSKAWSLGGFGITINVPIVLAFNAVLIIGALIGYFDIYVTNVIAEVLCFVIGTLSIAICAN